MGMGKRCWMEPLAAQKIIRYVPGRSLELLQLLELLFSA
jgi:hypothetical protein